MGVVGDVKHLTEGPHKKRHSSTFVMAALTEIIRLLEKAKKELNKGRYPLQEISSKYMHPATKIHFWWLIRVNLVVAFAPKFWKVVGPTNCYFA